MTKPAIDIEHLSEAELLDLNRRIVERIKLLRAMRTHRHMLEFSVGDRVCFESPDRGVITGTLVRYNRKTVTVLTSDGHRWNVAPQLLSKVWEQTNETSAGDRTRRGPLAPTRS